MSLERASAYLASWIASGGRYDVDALCDDVKIHEDLEYIRGYVVEWLRDGELIKEIELDRQLEDLPELRWF